MRRMGSLVLPLVMLTMICAWFPGTSFAASTQVSQRHTALVIHHAFLPASSPGQYTDCVPTSQSGSADGSGSGNGCGSGSFPWKWTTAGTATWTATWKAGVNQSRETSCHFWVYIPNNHAGAPHARYDVWTVTIDGLNPHWEGWLGHYLNQNNLNGWIDLGTYRNTGGSNQMDFIITTNNHDDLGVSGWQLAAAAMSFTPSF